MKSPRSRLTLGGLAFLAAASCGHKDESAPPSAGPEANQTTTRTANKAAQEKFEKAVVEMKDMEKRGAVDDAALQKMFRDAVKEDDTLVEAHYNLGVLADRQGQVDVAIQEYQRALNLNHKYPAAAVNEAALLVGQGKGDEATKLLESFVQGEPAAAGPRVSLAKLYREKKRAEDGLAQCRAALQREPKNLAAFETMAAIYADTGNAPMTRLVAARGLKVNDRDPPLHYTLGRIWLSENKIPEAVSEFKAALAASPDYRPARIDFAEIALQYRDFGNAQINYASLVKEQPDDIASLIGLGISDKGLGKYDEAKGAYLKVLEKDPKNPAATMNLAILHHRHLNDFPAALKYYQAYLEHPADDGPKLDAVKGYVTELEQTIAALKEAEKFDQAQKAQAEKDAAQQQQAQPASEAAGGDKPAEAVADKPAEAKP